MGYVTGDQSSENNSNNRTSNNRRPSMMTKRPNFQEYTVIVNVNAKGNRAFKLIKQKSRETKNQTNAQS